jgi:hypothetical protein
MNVDWRDKKSTATARHVLSKLQTLLRVDGDGRVSIARGNDFDLCVAILAACARFPDVFPERVRNTIVRTAVLDGRKRGEVDEVVVLQGIAGGQRSYLSTKPQRYILLSTISVEHSKKISRRNYDGARIRFSSTMPSSFQFPQTMQTALKYDSHHPLNYMYVRTEVQAREIISAAEVAIENIDLLRAIWNLARNEGRRRHTFKGRKRCINGIIFGPLHTLHNSDGSSATNLFWIEPVPLEWPSPRSLADHYPELVAFERWVRKRLSASPMEARLSSLLIRYGRALDESDLNTSFLKLWSVLEDLTATGLASYDTTIRRATFMFKDRTYHKAILEYLRTWRNRMVHEGASAEDAEEFVNQLQVYVEAILFSLLKQSSTFKSMDEFGHFLDLPTDPRVLKARIKHHRMALKAFGLILSGES